MIFWQVAARRARCGQRTAVAVLRPDGAEPDHRVIPSTPASYRKLINAIGKKEVVVCYEAGPCGYEPYRVFIQLGVACDVVAPSLIPRRPGTRVKTDRIDARDLARLHRAGELTTIRIPTTEEEAVRDLLRTREALKEDRRRAIQRIKAFLLKRGLRYPGFSRGFSKNHQQWVEGLRVGDPAAQLALGHLLAAFQTRQAQLHSIEGSIGETIENSPWLLDSVARLRAFRSIDTLSAATIATEVCDFRQFASASAFMAFTGLVPSEYSSGEHSYRGAITKAGNAHVRRVLVESSWSYRHRPAVSIHLRRRQGGQPPEVLAHCWTAQVRLNARYRRLIARGKPPAVVVTAVARELAGFIWGLMTERYAA